MRDHEAIINKIFKLLCTYKPQPETLREHLRQTLTGKFYPDRKVLLERGQVARELLFVSDGYVACYGFDADCEAQVLSIAVKNTLVFGKSLTAQSPSVFEWVCLPGTYLMALSHEALLELYVRFPGMEELARLIMADTAERDMSRLLLLSRNAEALVADFYARFKEFRTPGRMMLDADIAAYLLIAESTLRNVRTKLARQGRF